MHFLSRYIDNLIGKGLEVKVIIELLFYFSGSFIPRTLPLAVLLASLMTFGNLSEHNELSALKSAGISLPRIMLPLIILTFIVGLGSFFFSINVLPYANLKSRSLLTDIKKQRPDILIKEGIFYNGIDGYSIRVSKKDYKTSMLHKIKIYNHQEGTGNVKVTIADSGYMKITADTSNLIITVYNGYNYEEIQYKLRRKQKKTYPQRRDKFKEQKIAIELTGFGFNRTNEKLFKKNYEMMNLKQLIFAEDSLKKALDRSMISFSGDLLNSHYFIKKMEQDTERTDFLIQYNNEKDMFFNLDSIFYNLSESLKHQIVTSALNFARSSKKFISFNKIFIEKNKNNLRRHEIARHMKFTLSFACFIFFFIGAPLGTIIKKGGLGMSLIVSVTFFFIYYIITLIGEKLIKEDFIPTSIGMWVPLGIMMAAGIFLFYKAATDSIILNIDIYYNFIKKHFGFVRYFKEWF